MIEIANTHISTFYIVLHISSLSLHIWHIWHMHFRSFSYAINYIQMHADLHIVLGCPKFLRWPSPRSGKRAARHLFGPVLSGIAKCREGEGSGLGIIAFYYLMNLDDLSVRSWMESLLTTKCCSFRCLQCWLQYLLKSSVSSDTWQLRCWTCPQFFQLSNFVIVLHYGQIRSVGCGGSRWTSHVYLASNPRSKKQHALSSSGSASLSSFSVW